jgi:hypothetical protein
MRLDEVAQRAVRAVQTSAGRVEPMAQWEVLEKTVVSRRRSNAVAGVLVLVLVSAVAAWGLRTLTAPSRVEPAPRPVVGNTMSAGSVGLQAFHLYYPSTDLFLTKDAQEGTGGVGFYRADGRAGVNIDQAAHAVKNDGHWTPDPTAGTTAEQIADWAARRPFLTDTSVTEVTVGGRPAWRVSASLRPDAPLTSPEDVGLPPTAALLYGLGYLPGRVQEITFVDAPGGTVAAIWSWATDGDVRAISSRAVHDFITHLQLTSGGTESLG